jgi:hypothetical protein
MAAAAHTTLPALSSLKYFLEYYTYVQYNRCHFLSYP